MNAFLRKISFTLCCFLPVMFTALKAQDTNAMPADSAYGVVRISVCNLRAEGKFTSGMTTQALLGMPVRILQYTGWYEIQTPDDYTGWVHRLVITPMSKKEYDDWNRSEKIVVTSHYGFIYEKPDERSQCVSDAVAGNRLKWEGSEGDFYKVSYPDGRKGYIAKSLSQPETKWSRGEARCGKHRPDCLHHDRDSLSVGGYLYERGGLQRLCPHRLVHARYYYSQRRLSASRCREAYRDSSRFFECAEGRLGILWAKGDGEVRRKCFACRHLSGRQTIHPCFGGCACQQLQSGRQRL
ncbi:L-alanyl-gamma-D-glutamyl-L-diamino acid endopeptidase [Bacteroides pyogenes DSM 20611 = JCM 6294]|uniref:L-alanyl-gamma-D-glutamyl-L-diamino acid endopeptidase n=1 Tax=Bacteroides pyogenes DSM 20611 = JCM 6294 TaxID=1121100 RepID=W4PFS3_9BACE|nr:L-alanyl-gamma-D-glutamyl-L-diamino acid endopeptidase [Bacteroides pyogenes DSM 20611 = JCM 6294]